MASYSSHSRPQRGKIAAWAALIGGLLVIILSAFFVGAVTGIDPSIAARLVVVMLVPLFFSVIWSAPKQKGDPGLWLNHLLLLALMISIFWPPYVFFSFHGLPSLDPKRLLMMGIAMLWVYKVMSSSVMGARFWSRIRLGGWQLTVLMLYMAWRLISAGASPFPIPSLVQFVWEAIYYYLAFYVTLAALRDTGAARRLVMLLVYAALGIVLVSVAEHFAGHNLFAKLVPANADYADMQAAVLADKLRDGGNRVQATFEHPMVLAEYVVFMLPLVTFGAMTAARKSVRLACLVGVPLLFGVILMSGTRSAILTGGAIMVLSSGLYFLRNVQDGNMSLKAFFSILALIALVMGTLASASVVTQLIQGRNGGERGSSTSRLLQMRAAVPKIQKEPLLGYGVGVGNGELGFKSSRGRMSVDNYYLTLALDSGLPGAALYILFTAGFCWMGVRMYFTQGPDETRILGGMLGLSILGVLVTKTVLSIDKNLTFVFVGFAILIVLKEHMQQSRDAVGHA
ncbi:O-antigen ligase [Rugamonas sp.]|uniref:O-antigen ligase family protein n=1 Tax=Rugamonas sp. TaxID=1926287 RepID=UPI0025D7E5B4|nr:O-antigen ligase family protein [Rugamonas sp.]